MIMAAIQAHSNSTRFPGKIYEKLAGKSILQRVVESARDVVQNVVVLGVESDQELRDYCIDNRIPVYLSKEPENDLVARYLDCMTAYRVANVVRLTSDCPLLSVPMLDYCVRIHMTNQMDFTSNGWPLARTAPDGWDVEVISQRLMLHVDKMAGTPYDREHCTSYIYWNEPELVHSDHPFKLCNVKYGLQMDTPENKCSVDTPEDLERLRERMDAKPASLSGIEEDRSK